MSKYVVEYRVHANFVIAHRGSLTVEADDEDEARIQAYIQTMRLPEVRALVGPSHGAVQLVSVREVL